MKINKSRLKFARDDRFIKKTMKEVFEKFDFSKLKKDDHGYTYDDNIKISSWYGSAYDKGLHYEITINGEFFEDEVVVGFFRSLQRTELLEEFYNKFDSICKEREKAWRENKAEIKEKFLCEMYKDKKGE
jgi:hypothetical protein